MPGFIVNGEQHALVIFMQPVQCFVITLSSSDWVPTSHPHLAHHEAGDEQAEGNLPAGGRVKRKKHGDGHSVDSITTMACHTRIEVGSSH